MLSFENKPLAIYMKGNNKTQYLLNVTVGNTAQYLTCVTSLKNHKNSMGKVPLIYKPYR